VKPQNILVTPDQRVKVTDFGIARALVSIQADEQMDIVWGSPQYFSPEQATGRAPVPASDVYGLGVILYEMLTGHLPFDSLSTDELARLHINAIPKNPREHNPRIDDNLSLIVLKVLSKEPTARYRTADQLGRVLISFSQKPGSIRTSQQRTLIRENIFNQSTQQDIANKKSESGIINPVGLDWKTIFLGLITLISVGGLIPFWLWIYFIMK
jgi:serine/threonine-protein kinase